MESLNWFEIFRVVSAVLAVILMGAGAWTKLH